MRKCRNRTYYSRLRVLVGVAILIVGSGLFFANTAHADTNLCAAYPQERCYGVLLLYHSSFLFNGVYGNVDVDCMSLNPSLGGAGPTTDFVDYEFWAVNINRLQEDTTWTEAGLTVGAGTNVPSGPGLYRFWAEDWGPDDEADYAEHFNATPVSRNVLHAVSIQYNGVNNYNINVAGFTGTTFHQTHNYNAIQTGAEQTHWDSATFGQSSSLGWWDSSGNPHTGFNYNNGSLIVYPSFTEQGYSYDWEHKYDKIDVLNATNPDDCT
jgi:hypothetical protein